MSDELYQFLVADYFATGEGRTVMLLITRAYPHADDYEDYVLTSSPPQYVVKNSAKFRAAREFIEEFGSYYAQAARNLSREEFLAGYCHFLPEVTKNMLTSESQPGNMNFKQQFHFNFS